MDSSHILTRSQKKQLGENENPNSISCKNPVENAVMKLFEEDKMLNNAVQSPKRLSRLAKSPVSPSNETTEATVDKKKRDSITFSESKIVNKVEQSQNTPTKKIPLWKPIDSPKAQKLITIHENGKENISLEEEGSGRVMTRSRRRSSSTSPSRSVTTQPRIMTRRSIRSLSESRTFPESPSLEEGAKTPIRNRNKSLANSTLETVVEKIAQEEISVISEEVTEIDKSPKGNSKAPPPADRNIEKSLSSVEIKKSVIDSKSVPVSKIVETANDSLQKNQTNNKEIKTNNSSSDLENAGKMVQKEFDTSSGGDLKDVDVIKSIIEESGEEKRTLKIEKHDKKQSEKSENKNLEAEKEIDEIHVETRSLKPLLSEVVKDDDKVADKKGTDELQKVSSSGTENGSSGKQQKGSNKCELKVTNVIEQKIPLNTDDKKSPPKKVEAKIVLNQVECNKNEFEEFKKINSLSNKKYESHNTSGSGKVLMSDKEDQEVGNEETNLNNISVKSNKIKIVQIPTSLISVVKPVENKGSTKNDTRKLQKVEVGTVNSTGSPNKNSDVTKEQNIADINVQNTLISKNENLKLENNAEKSQEEISETSISSDITANKSSPGRDTKSPGKERTLPDSNLKKVLSPEKKEVKIILTPVKFNEIKLCEKSSTTDGERESDGKRAGVKLNHNIANKSEVNNLPKINPEKKNVDTEILNTNKNSDLEGIATVVQLSSSDKQKVDGAITIVQEMNVSNSYSEEKSEVLEKEKMDNTLKHKEQSLIDKLKKEGLSDSVEIVLLGNKSSENKESEKESIQEEIDKSYVNQQENTEVKNEPSDTLSKCSDVLLEKETKIDGISQKKENNFIVCESAKELTEDVKEQNEERILKIARENLVQKEISDTARGSTGPEDELNTNVNSLELSGNSDSDPQNDETQYLGTHSLFYELLEDKCTSSPKKISETTVNKISNKEVSKLNVLEEVRIQSDEQKVTEKSSEILNLDEDGISSKKLSLDENESYLDGSESSSEKVHFDEDDRNSDKHKFNTTVNKSNSDENNINDEVGVETVELENTDDEKDDGPESKDDHEYIFNLTESSESNDADDEPASIESENRDDDSTVNLKLINKDKLVTGSSNKQHSISPKTIEMPTLEDNNKRVEANVETCSVKNNEGKQDKEKLVKQTLYKSNQYNTKNKKNDIQTCQRVEASVETCSVILELQNDVNTFNKEKSKSVKRSHEEFVKDDGKKHLNGKSKKRIINLERSHEELEKNDVEKQLNEKPEQKITNLEGKKSTNITFNKKFYDESVVNSIDSNDQDKNNKNTAESQQNSIHSEQKVSSPFTPKKLRKMKIKFKKTLKNVDFAQLLELLSTENEQVKSLNLKKGDLKKLKQKILMSTEYNQFARTVSVKKIKPDQKIYKQKKTESETENEKSKEKSLILSEKVEPMTQIKKVEWLSDATSSKRKRKRNKSKSKKQLRVDPPAVTPNSIEGFNFIKKIDLIKKKEETGNNQKKSEPSRIIRQPTRSSEVKSTKDSSQEVKEQKQKVKAEAATSRKPDQKVAVATREDNPLFKIRERCVERKIKSVCSEPKEEEGKCKQVLIKEHGNEPKKQVTKEINKFHVNEKRVEKKQKKEMNKKAVQPNIFRNAGSLFKVEASSNTKNDLRKNTIKNTKEPSGFKVEDVNEKNTIKAVLREEDLRNSKAYKAGLKLMKKNLDNNIDTNIFKFSEKARKEKNKGQAESNVQQQKEKKAGVNKLPTELLEALGDEPVEKKRKVVEPVQQFDQKSSKKRKLKLKSAILEESYIPLSAGGATQFAVARLDKEPPSTSAQTAANFRSNQLYGSHNRRVSAKELQNTKKKYKANSKE